MVQNITGASVFVAREQGVVTGMTAFFLVRAEGMRALDEGRFDAVNIDPGIDLPSARKAGGRVCVGFCRLDRSRRGAGGESVGGGARDIVLGVAGIHARGDGRWGATDFRFAGISGRSKAIRRWRGMMGVIGR